ncbi:MAG: hypothetical protein WBB74_04815 [Gaiellaceae bacterium]
MSVALAQREIALAAVALLAAVFVVAFVSPQGHGESTRALPQPVVGPGGWYPALAGVRRPAYGHLTNCGVLVQGGTLGVTDSVLPCNAKLYVTRKGAPKILTQVIERRAVVLGRRFDVTPALADKLGLEGVEGVTWTYAR